MRPLLARTYRRGRPPAALPLLIRGFTRLPGPARTLPFCPAHHVWPGRPGRYRLRAGEPAVGDGEKYAPGVAALVGLLILAEHLPAPLPVEVVPYGRPAARWLAGVRKMQLSSNCPFSTYQPESPGIAAGVRVGQPLAAAGQWRLRLQTGRAGGVEPDPRPVSRCPDL